MKRNNKKTLKCAIIIILMLIIGVLACNKSYAKEGTDALTYIGGSLVTGGIGTVLIWAVQLLILIFGLAGQAIITALTAMAPGDNSNVMGIKDIIFNRTSITTASFFTNQGNSLGLDKELPGFWSENNPIYTISNSVSQYYYIIRNLSIAILLFVLLYIGIRMAISTVASEEAKYKKMLQNWVVSLAVVFVLHYIMILTFYFNNKIVDILYQIAGNASEAFNDSRGTLASQALVPVSGFGEAVVYTMMIGMELTFFFMYIKRSITLAFLIVIAPLITVTYSIDKIADGRSQALNTWLKEFIFTVLIQPFHCIIYIVLIRNVVGLINEHEGIGIWIIYILMLSFAREAEKIIKKIFNIQTDSMPGVESMGALALGVMTTIGGLGKAKASGGSGGGSGKKMPDMKKEQGAETQALKLGPNGEESVVKPQEKTQAKPVEKQKGKPKSKEAELEEVWLKRSAERAALTKPQRARLDELVAEGMGRKPEEITAMFRGLDRKRRLNKVKQAISGAAKWEARRFTPSGLNSGFGRMLTGGEGNTHEGRMRLLRDVLKTGAAVGAGAMALGMADSKAAIGAGLTAYAAGGKIEGAIKDHKNNVQLENNEEIFTDRYERAVVQYAREHGISADAAEAHFEGLVDRVENDTLRQQGLSDTERGFVSSYKSMKKSYKIMGEEDPEKSARKLMRNKNQDIVLPPDNNQNNDSNNNQNNP